MHMPSKLSLNILSLLALIASLAGSALIVTPAYATITAIVVNTSTDSTNACHTTGTGTCSLRDAVTYFNTNGTGTVTFASNYTITLGSQLPAVAQTLTITGNGAANTIVQASTCNPVTLPGACTPATYGVFAVNSGGNLTLNSLAVQYGNPTSGNGGGGVSNSGTLIITNSTFSGNSGSSASDGGGGVYNAGTLTVTNSSLSGNSAQFGAGLYNNTLTEATITDSTFTGNSASTQGGGVFNNGVTLVIANSTFSANSAAGAGGGVWNGDIATITNSSFSGNSGTGIENAVGTLNLKNTIVANSTSGGDCLNAATIGTNTNNLIKDTGSNACGLVNGTNGNIIGSDPNLGALANNGGANQTMALLLPSPALDAGDDTTCAAAPVNDLDQRGITRPQGAHCDIGAFEYVPAAVVVNTNADSTNACGASGTGTCSLRDAITYINTVGDGLITFAANYTITLGSQLPAVTSVITVTGNGAANTIIQANASPHTASYRVLAVNSGGNLTLHSLTVQNGDVTGGGGGVLNSGALTITDSTFSANSASTGGGGVFNFAALTITDSTFSGNSASQGGGIYSSTVATLTVTNSTFSGNSGASGGGGVLNDHIATVTDSTFSGNSASSNAGGIYNANGTLNLKNTIIANSTNGDCVNGSGTVGTSTNNLIKDSSNACGLTNGTNGNIIGSDPNLGALMNNGGPTWTMALSSGSPATDAGDDTTCGKSVGSPNFGAGGKDQRGVTRPQGTHCDIGAYEAVSPTDLSLSPSNLVDNQPAGATVGSLTSTDADASATFSYSLVSGTGSTDNASFTISGNALKTAGVFNSAIQSSYSVRIRTADQRGFYDEKAFTVSVAPHFVDVPDSYWAASWINRLYLDGITGGCSTNPLDYCPDNNVTRDQMAVFLEKGIHGSSFNPPTVTLTFTDTSTNFARYWIEALKADGVTGGCGTNLYCPTSATTRAQMAVFLLRAEHGGSYSPPAVGGSTGFSDVPISSTYAPWIKQLAAEGVTSGCGAGMYCPDSSVTRAQMAVFLVKTFHLP